MDILFLDILSRVDKIMIDGDLCGVAACEARDECNQGWKKKLKELVDNEDVLSKDTLIFALKKMLGECK